jgi:hypothetical protein
MATAIHNIEGDSRLSECDGAGGVVADLADNIMQGINGGWGVTEYNCNSPSQMDLATLNLATGPRIRVAIVWAADPDSPNYLPESPDKSRPSADLDLLIVGPSGVVAYSVSEDNTYEIVDFQAIGSGAYTIRVLRNECESAYPPNYLAWAWWIEPPQ